MFIVPKMRQSSRAQVVSIEPASSQTKPFLIARRDVQDLLKHLTSDADSGASSAKIQLTTVVCGVDGAPQDRENVANLSARIISGIQSQRSEIRINQKISLIECKLSHKK